MGENSKIEWTDHTFNPWVGCAKVSPGCDRCYAEGWAKRSGLVQWGPHGERRRTSAANWNKPRRWAKEARRTGKRPRVFCASLADVWDNQVPQAWRQDLFNLIGATPELDWLLLTKRPENIEKMLPGAIGAVGMAQWPWPNVWLGTTCEDQKRFDHRWPILCEIPAALRFISYEPAIGPLELAWGDLLPQPGWLICGGESGHGARTMDLQWARDLRDECAELGLPFFFKQTTGKGPIPDDLMVRQFPREAT
jgi:protein gp37